MVETRTESAAVPPEILWPEPPDTTPLTENAVHAWALSLAANSQCDGEDILSTDEKTRAAQFRLEIHRRRYRNCRMALRRILGRYLRADPREIEFIYLEHGKPALADKFASDDLRFNVAHSENLGLIAVARRSDLGADVEAIRPVRDFDAIAERFFAKDETKALRNLDASQQKMAFFNVWTRKEAWLKGTGAGIGELLNEVEVSCGPDEPARLLRLPKPFTPSDWSLFSFNPAWNFVGAVAVHARNASLHCWQWVA